MHRAEKTCAFDRWFYRIFLTLMAIMGLVATAHGQDMDGSLAALGTDWVAEATDSETTNSETTDSDATDLEMTLFEDEESSAPCAESLSSQEIVSIPAQHGSEMSLVADEPGSCDPVETQWTQRWDCRSCSKFQNGQWVQGRLMEVLKRYCHTCGGSKTCGSWISTGFHCMESAPCF